jgi:hypothetical protein
MKAFINKIVLEIKLLGAKLLAIFSVHFAQIVEEIKKEIKELGKKK